MLAVVFWHARFAGTDRDDYREALFAFHDVLNGNKPAGLRYSCTFSVPAVPWFDPPCEAHEDWYVLGSFSGIDALEDAVLNRDDMEPHRFLMRNTASASGAVLALRSGQARVFDHVEAYWIAGAVRRMTLDFETLQATRAIFWKRSLALGPKEQLVLSTCPIPAIAGDGVTHITRELLWRPAK